MEPGCAEIRCETATPTYPVRNERYVHGAQLSISVHVSILVVVAKAYKHKCKLTLVVELFRSLGAHFQ